MAYEASQPLKISATAGADLSGQQYKLVRLNTSGEAVVCSAVTDVPVGVLQNKPVQGQQAEIVVIGVTKVQADVALDEGNLIGTSADGQAQVVTVGSETTVYIVGQVAPLGGVANAGEIATVIVNCASPARAA